MHGVPLPVAYRLNVLATTLENVFLITNLSAPTPQPRSAFLSLTCKVINYSHAERLVLASLKYDLTNHISGFAKVAIGVYGLMA
jgi:uncharacterized protein YhhL (DUF1145 family)